MKKKIVLVLSSILGAFLLGLSFIIGNKKTVKADVEFESEYTLMCYGKQFDLPVTCFIGYYDCDMGEAKIRNTMYRGSTTYYYKYTINGPNDIDDFIINFDGDQLYINYYTTLQYDLDDCLSETFMIFSYDEDLFAEKEKLNGCCISELMEIEGVVGVVSPDCQYVTTEYVYTVDKLSPVINGGSAYYITDMDNPVDVATIQSCLRASDNADGDLTDSIVIKEDNYTSSDKKVGEYSVIFEVSDSANNKATFTVIVSVQDITAPTISGETNITSKTSSPLNVTNHIANLTVTDNSSLSSYFDGKITVQEDNFTANKFKLGTYTVTYATTDEAGNEGTFTMNVTVVDDVKPIINGNNSYNKSVTASLKVSQIMTGLKASDDVDGDLYKKITIKQDNYSTKSATVGTYTIVFTVKDSSDNVSNDFIVTVKVTDNVLPIFYINSTLINVTEFNAMTHQDIVDFLIDTKTIGENVTNVSFIFDNYTENSDKVGTYKVSLKATYSEDKSDVIDVTIKVNELSQEAEIIDKEPEKTESFWSKIVTIVLNILTKVSDFFKNTVNFLIKVVSNI